MSATQNALTPEMVRNYISSQGSDCPFCRSSEIKAGKAEADGDSAWSPVTCDECGQEWRDVFFLGAIDTLDEHGRYSDTIMPAPERSDDPGRQDATTPSPPDPPTA
jgi:hypothetical protein